MWEEVLIYTSIFMGIRYFLMLGLQAITDKSPKEVRISQAEIHHIQHEREGVWPIGILLDGIVFFGLAFFGWLSLTPGPFWLCLGVMILSHIFAVEPIYYFYHRVLHWPKFYRLHHIYHHKSITLEPITSMSFDLLERFSYTVLFSLPIAVVYLLGIFDFKAFLVFYVLFDILNSMGHLNIKLENSRYKNSKIFKWLIYSPEYHNKHHTLFTSNYALFMPIWDRLFNTFAGFGDD